MSEANTNNNELIVKLITDLQSDLKQLPTRHEFEALTNKIDLLETKYEKYLLKQEFETFKEYNKEYIEGHAKKNDERFKAIEEKAANIGKIPSWLVAVIITVVGSLLSFGIEHQFPTQQPTAQVQQQYHNR